eukprot:TRINITY_DN14621_c0_g2_i1.p1 TRINITY_DN14621_c0_g2~~TRINITY_DN14621_c0_g2_i1.p1  ORF type:complete len:712 (+),score=94.51 TRINITY_DN14621_c0_g2_i1:124-2259(+)
MKFGKNLDRGRVPEWADFYVNYAKLKRFIECHADNDKEVDCEAKARLDDDWEAEIWAEVSKVNGHFEATAHTLEDRVDALECTWRDMRQRRLLYHEGDETPNGPQSTRTNKEKAAKRHLEISMVDAMVSLGHITDFSSMNYTAFYKILKKYDKKAKKGARSLPLLAEIEKQPFHDKKRMEALRDRIDALNRDVGGDVAELYREHFERHHGNTASVCFWLGFTTMGLLSTAVLIIMPATSSIYTLEKFMSIIPIFRFVLMLNFLVWVSGLSVFWFEKYKVNYIFLLNIDPNCPVDSTLLLRLASTMSGAWLLIFWALLADFKFQIFQQSGELITVTLYPLSLLITIVLVFLFVGISAGLECRHQLHLFQCFLSVAMAPLVQVTFAANILGDVLTSFNRPMGDLIYSACYISRFVTRRHHGSHHFILETKQVCDEFNRRAVSSVILSLPYFFRLMQCLRRFADDTSAKKHLANAGKYLCSIIVTAIGWAMPNSIPWVACYTLATFYACFWDTKVDWGLRWESGGVHRNQQMYPPRVYSLFVATNVVGRSTWPLSALTPKASSTVAMDIFISALSVVELFRRAQWAIVRIEHEHLTNSSKYRTLCWVPPLARTQPEPSTGELLTTIPSLLTSSAPGRGEHTHQEPAKKCSHSVPLLSADALRGRNEASVVVRSQRALSEPSKPSRVSDKARTQSVSCALGDYQGLLPARSTWLL